MSRGTPFHESILGKPLLIWVAISVENLPRPIPFRGLLLGLFFKLRSLMHAQERFERFGVGIRFFWGSQFQSRHLHCTLCSIRLVNCSEDPVADAIPDSSQSRLVPQQLGNCIGEAYYHGVNPNWVQNMTKLNVRLPKRHAMFFVRG